LLHLALGEHRPPAHRGDGGARGPRRQHRVDPDPPPAPAQPIGRAPEGLDSDRRGARADAHIVMETNAPEARRALFLAFSALLFVASAAATILWSRAMAEGDRKSTRLNSSHGSISYAVFCLKKKKQNSTAKKSAQVIGDVIGKYHPHGEVAVYHALVRVAQHVDQRYRCIAGKRKYGNSAANN